MNCKAEWMSGKYGLMVHYLPPALEGRSGERYDNLDDILNSFDLETFLAAFDSSGAEWLIFTLGQNTGMYNSPNPVMDKYAGKGHCPQRDLAFELAEALHKRGKRFMVYLPAEVFWNTTIRESFGWQCHPDRAVQDTFRQELFQQRWLELIGYWATRFGRLLDGWFYDGCSLIAFTQEDYARWNAASRSGNPDAVVSFNSSGFDIGITPWINFNDDYFPGEATMLKDGLPLMAWRDQETAINKTWWPQHGEVFAENNGYRPRTKYVPGTEHMLWHVLTPIDAFWYNRGDVSWLDGQPCNRYMNPKNLSLGEMEPPMYSDDELKTLLNSFCSVGGAVTLNVGIRMDGSIGDQTAEQLKRLNSLMGR